MKAGFCFRLLIAAMMTVSAPQFAQDSDKPTESEHVRGPNGLEGWTLNVPLPPPDRPNEEFPVTLVIARNGHVIRKFQGGAFIWRWVFWADGKQVAYETGPLHFSLTCVLADVKTGRELASYDCFHGIPDDAPDWLEALEGGH